RFCSGRLRTFSSRMKVGKRRRLRARSAQARLLEHAIRLEHVTEPVFRTSVATIRIRMMALHQFLIARLDVIASCLRIKAKRFQRLGLKGLGLALARLARVLRPAEQVEGVAHAVVVAGAAGARLCE